MKCASNAKSCNPRKPEHNIARNYMRQPLKDHEYPECPFRVNGECTNAEVLKSEADRIARDEERKRIEDSRVYVGGIEFEKAVRIIELITGLKQNTTHYFISKELRNIFGKDSIRLDDVTEAYKNDPRSYLAYIRDYGIAYKKLMERFWSVDIYPDKIELWGYKGDFDFCDDIEVDWFGQVVKFNFTEKTNGRN